MKKVFTLVLLALVGTGAFAQKATTVKGVVLDSLTRQGEPAAILYVEGMKDYVMFHLAVPANPW